MATPPTRVSYVIPASGNFSTTGASKVTAAFDVQAGDLIVVMGSMANANTYVAGNPSASGGSVTWTARAQAGTSGTNNSGAWIWTGAVGATATGITVTLNRPTATNDYWGFSATVWRNHGGVGSIFNGTNGTGSSAPAVAATCSANSAVQCQINDWNAVTSARTWRTINGSAESESTYVAVAGQHTVYGGYRTDTGAAGSITQGLTAPTNLRWVLVGVEILGTSASGTTGTLSASVPRVTASISGTVAAPSYTGTLSTSAPRVSASITGTAAGPSYTGTLSASAPRATGSLAGTVTAPSYTGSLAAATPLFTGSLAGTAAVPTYTGTVNATTPTVTGSIAGTFTAAPGYTGTLSAATPATTGALAGTATPPTYSGAISATTPKVTGSASGTATPPTYAGTLSAAVPPTRSTISGTVTTPAGAATLSGTVPLVTASMSGTFTAPVWTGTLSAQVARLSASMLGTASGPVYVGTLGAPLPKITGSLSGTATPPTATGSLLASLPLVTGSLSGSAQDGPATNFEGRILRATISIPAASGFIAAPSSTGEITEARASARLSILRATGVIT